MPTPTRTSNRSGQYRGHRYTIEEHFAQLFDNGHLVNEYLTRVRIHVDSKLLIPGKDIPDKNFTGREPSEEVVHAYIDILEAQG